MNAVAQPEDRDAAAVRPFQVNFAESELTNLRTSSDNCCAAASEQLIKMNMNNLRMDRSI